MVLLYSATLFLSAALLFLVQPMFAKMLLPLAGGTPAVWNTCMLFFQAALLSGYAWAHGSAHWLGLRRQMRVQLGLLAAPLALLPLAVPAGSAPAQHDNPIPWLLLLLVSSVGLPFLAVATSAPTLQRWFAETRARSAGDPYFLYAASNAGSILALLAYPLAIEPAMALRAQSRAWTGGYVLLVVLTALCALAARRNPAALPDGAAALPDGAAAAPDAVGTGNPGRVTARRRLNWVALSAVPSGLLLSVTSFVTRDLAPVPLLWILPLSLYLLTFVIAFGSMPSAVRKAAGFMLPVAIVTLAFLFVTSATEPLSVIVPLHLAAFLVLALACHGALADDRPRARHLTEFYLWIAAGGLLGGAFVTLAAPVVFTSSTEYPLLVTAAAIVAEMRFGARGTSSKRVLDFLLPVGFGLLTAGIILAVGSQTSDTNWRLTALAAVLAGSLLFTGRPVRFGLAVGLAMLAGWTTWEERNTVEYRQRTFFGSYQIERDERREIRSLLNGTTLHGVQSTDPMRLLEPLSYYHRTSPIGEVFSVFDGRLENGRIAVVGLGIGTLAAYAKPGQEWVFYEIDPAVERIARDPRFFTYLAHCADLCRVVIGDARLSLLNAPDERFDLIVLDAFNSDAIPVHLLTREALELYVQRLKPGGVMAFHISNRHLRLEPVLGGLAADLGLAGIVQYGEVTPRQNEQGMEGSDWVVLARTRQDLQALAAFAGWREVETTGGSAWTDDFSNILGVLRGRERQD
ncbi:MAG: fused MFS/spermidine synthase [Vicinamibacterales bacterium]